MNEDAIRKVVENVMRRVGSQPAAVEPAPVDYYAPWTGEVRKAISTPGLPSHPSTDQFTIGEAAEAASVVSELVDFLQAEKCTIEADKPCDHCGTCKSRGF